jgi:hypothetical protein
MYQIFFGKKFTLISTLKVIIKKALKIKFKVQIQSEAHNYGRNRNFDFKFKKIRQLTYGFVNC